MKTTRSSSDHSVRWIAIGALVLLLLFALSGCALPTRGTHKSSNVVEFLYPHDDRPYVEPRIPTLRLPLRVGIAFAPSVNGHHGFNQSFPEASKQALLDEVADQFRSLPFVEEIEVIPGTYLRPGGSFENLDQLKSLLGIDVIAILAYDQAQASTEDEASILYWTVIGSYIFPTRKNETHTLMEAVVFDISSRNLLFRAPGSSTIAHRNTLAGSIDELRRDSAQSFTAATEELTRNLHDELLRFQVRLKEEPAMAHIEHKPGYTGAGSLGGAFAAGLALLAGLRRWSHR